jgi:general secretion pathway protein G
MPAPIHFTCSPKPSLARHLHARQSGFTLIEILVVMTLIALLLTLAVPRYFSALDKGRLAVQQQNIATLRDAIDKFKADKGRYPDELDELVVQKYLRQIPLDPLTEAANWLVIAPSDSSPGHVYDVQSAARPAQQATEVQSM